jgi:hypothetical protein
MTEYYAVIDDQGRTGPFQTMQEASRVLKDASKSRGHTDAQARQFFLYESSVVEVQSLNGQQEFFNLGWLARDESGREELPSEMAVTFQEPNQLKDPILKEANILNESVLTEYSPDPYRAIRGLKSRPILENSLRSHTFAVMAPRLNP